MSDLKTIEEHYKKLSSNELQELSKSPESLRIEIIPILQSELLKRNFQEEALNLTNYLVNNHKKNRYSDISKEQLKELINERLESGESIESIKIDLQDEGINVFDLLIADAQIKENIQEQIHSLQNKGYEELEINQIIQEKYNLQSDEIDTIKFQARKKAKQEINLGYVISIISLVILIFAIGIGASVGFGMIIILAIGIWKIIKGYDQLKT